MNVRHGFVVILIMIFLASIAASAGDGSLNGSSSIDNLLSESDAVAVVKITSGFLGQPGEIGESQVIYRAIVIRAIRGCQAGDVIYFGPKVGRGVGAEYLAFLNQTEIPVRSLLDSIPSEAPAALLQDSTKHIYAEHTLMEISPRSTDTSIEYWADIHYSEYQVPSWLPTEMESNSRTNDGTVNRRWVYLPALCSHLDSINIAYPKRVNAIDQVNTGCNGCVKRFSFRKFERGVYSSDSLPSYIVEAANKNIHQRLGETIPGTIEFFWSLLVDSVVFHQIRSGKAPPAYQLTYLFKDTVDRVQLCATVSLDPHGQIIDSISLPSMRKDPLKRRILPLDSASHIARNSGLTSKRYNADVLYDKKTDSIVWQFDWADPLSADIQRYMWLDAHSGKVIRTFYATKFY